MIFRLSTKMKAADRIEIGKVEQYEVSWRPSDFTVWISNDSIMPTNLGNSRAYSELDVLPVAKAMLRLLTKPHLRKA